MPLTFDFSWDELQHYQGINPRPADFDTFWDSGLAEMRAVEPAIELIPSEFSAPFAECFDLYFTGVGGARVHAKMVRPKGQQQPGPAVLHFHGYTGRIQDWADEMKLAFAAAGITYIGMDCRGQGGYSEDIGGVQGTTMRGQIVRGLADALQGAPQKLLFRQIFLDAAQLAGIALAMDTVDAERVGVWGISQGGGLTVACAALEPRLARVAPVFPFLADYQRVWEMDLAENAYWELSDWFRKFDPLHQREAEIFTNLGYIDIQHLAPRIRGEVHWSIGLSDKICPPSTQFAAYNKISAPKAQRVYPDFAHESLPGNSDAIFQFMLGL